MAPFGPQKVMKNRPRAPTANGESAFWAVFQRSGFGDRFQRSRLDKEGALSSDSRFVADERVGDAVSAGCRVPHLPHL
jgi:hypothetical protein